MRSIVFFMGLLLGVALSLVLTVQASSHRIPVDYEHTGADASYHHGDHCIDLRTF